MSVCITWNYRAGGIWSQLKIYETVCNVNDRWRCWRISGINLPSESKQECTITGIPGTLLYLNEQLPLYILVNVVAFGVAFGLTWMFGFNKKMEQ